MSLSDQILCQGFIVISRRLHTEYHLLQSMPGLQYVCLKTKIFKTLFRVFKDEPSQERIACGRTEKGMVSLFCSIGDLLAKIF